MRKKLILAASAAALAVSALAGVALAQGQPQGAPARGGHAEMLFQADSNHDDVLTRQEFDAGRAAKFAQADANHDGLLTRDEMRAMRPHREDGDHHGRRGHRRGMMLDRADANHDGRITRDEFLAGPIEMFNHLDANHDGVLTGAEAQPPRMGPDGPGRHGGMDADHNGSISRAEFNAAGDELFSRLDANHDGRVTRAEAEAARPFGPPPGGPPPEGAQPPR